jgi:hypothetical protein
MYVELSQFARLFLAISLLVPISFPWDALKAETLHAICKDLGIGTKGKRDETISFLKDAEA